MHGPSKAVDVALMECPECKSQISTEAAACPKCGKPLRATWSQPGPVAVTANAPLPVVIKPRTSWLTMGCAMLIVPCLGFTVVASFLSASNPKTAPAAAVPVANPKRAPSASVPVAAPTTEGTASDPATPKRIAAQMTKLSNVHGVPQPADGKTSAGMLVTKVGTVAEITSFYRDWMPAHGWTFDAKNSVLDPNQGVKKSLGFTTVQVWCKRTKPITTVSIIVGSGDSTDRGKFVEMSVVNLADEESCP